MPANLKVAVSANCFLTPSCKLIARVLSAPGSVIDCFHYDVCTDMACGLAVANHKRSVAVFTDYVLFVWSIQNRFHDGHQVAERIMKKNTGVETKTAGIINQCNHVDTVLLPICGLPIRLRTRITTPYFVYMGGTCPDYLSDVPSGWAGW